MNKKVRKQYTNLFWIFTFGVIAIFSLIEPFVTAGICVGLMLVNWLQIWRNE